MNFFDVFLAYIIIYIENQASRHSPPHTQADLGVGGNVRERELDPRDHVTCYVIAWPGHMTIPRRRGGGPTAS